MVFVGCYSTLPSIDNLEDAASYSENLSEEKDLEIIEGRHFSDFDLMDEERTLLVQGVL